MPVGSILVTHTVEHIWEWLGKIPDPEIPVISLIDLGIIRNVELHGEAVEVTITPTYSGCPAMAVMEEDIRSELERHGITDVRVNRKISPAWTTDWMTESGQKKLLAYGIAPPTAAYGPKCCPRCSGRELEKISQFSSTPCKALWRCQSCLEPFEYFKCI